MALKIILRAVLLGLFGLAITLQPAYSITNQRYQQVAAQGVVFYWQLKSWQDHSLLCEIYVKHESIPTGEEIGAYCGADRYQEFAEAPPCDSFVTQGDSKTCAGSFLVNLGKHEGLYPEMVPLPLPEASYAILDCQPGAWCQNRPALQISGSEPLPTNQINQVQLTVDQKTLTCRNKDTCQMRLPVTEGRGIWVDYWVNSDFGDESPRETVHLRNRYSAQNGGQYMVEVLSPENIPIEAAVLWDSFPTLEYPGAEMYARVDGAANLKTAEHLYYLSGKLIFTGKVDARGCEQGGLLDNGSANACGEQRAFSTAVEWQNQYNVSIEAAGDAYRLPARVLKGIIAQESQFWPEPGIEFEYGLGSLSENGIDTLFTWDTPSYLAVCLPALGEDACQTGYDHLSPDQRAYLRGLALRAIGTDQEIDLIARTLKACSVQVGQMVRNETGQAPGKVTTYEDLWNLTIANYHAGAGCMAEGISKLVEGEQAISYENFCAVNASCPTACVFVERVLGYISP